MMAKKMILVALLFATTLAVCEKQTGPTVTVRAFSYTRTGVTQQPPQVIKYARWQGSIEAALSETDPKKMLERVHAAEIAIFNRLLELAQQSEHVSSQVERQAIADACKTLRGLKRDRLGFPDWETK
jgi:hypothetical protein